MDDKRQELFQNEKVSKAVLTLALPTMTSLLVSVFYNMADTFFIGKTNDASQVAAVSLAMPIFFIFMAFGNLYGIGGSSVISRALGAKKYDNVKHVSSFCFYFGILTSVVLGGFFLTFMPFIISLTGATGDAGYYAGEYLKYLAMGAPFVLLANAMSNLVRSDGGAKAAMIGMMIGTVTNIILDPIMILYLNMGVAGAAVATVIGNAFSVIYYIIILTNAPTMLSIKLKDFRIKGVLGDVYSIGIPGSITNILMSLATTFYNSFLIQYGDNPVAGMGIASKCSSLTSMMIMGLSMGAQPLIGYNYGAKNYKRMKEVISFAIKAGMTVGICVGIVFFIGAENIIQLFINDAQIIHYGAKMLRIQAVTGSIVAGLFITMNALQSMGKPKIALFISLTRQGIFFIPSIILLDITSQLEGLMYAQSVSDVLSVTLALFMLRRLFKTIEEH